MRYIKRETIMAYFKVKKNSSIHIKVFICFCFLNYPKLMMAMSQLSPGKKIKIFKPLLFQSIFAFVPHPFDVVKTQKKGTVQ